VPPYGPTGLGRTLLFTLEIFYPPDCLFIHVMLTYVSLFTVSRLIHSRQTDRLTDRETDTDHQTDRNVHSDRLTDRHLPKVH